VTALEKSSKKQRTSSVDNTAQAFDVNISGTSGTPVSDVGESTTRRTRRSVVSMPSLMEIPPPEEILPPIVDNDEQLVQVPSSGDEMVMASGSNEAMVGANIPIFILMFIFAAASSLLFEGHSVCKKPASISGGKWFYQADFD